MCTQDPKDLEIVPAWSYTIIGNQYVYKIKRARILLNRTMLVKLKTLVYKFAKAMFYRENCRKPAVVADTNSILAGFACIAASEIRAGYFTGSSGGICCLFLHINKCKPMFYFHLFLFLLN
jgi:hypothetical protein